MVLTTTYPRWNGDTLPAFVHELSRRLATQFEVTVLAPHCAGAATREIIDGVHIVRFRYAPERWEVLCYGSGMIEQTRKHPWLRLLLPWMYLRFLASAVLLHWRQPVNVVHAHWILPQGIVATLLRYLTGVPFVVTCHGGDVTALRGPIARWLRRWVGNASRTIAPVSQHLFSVIHGEGVAREKLTCAPMGVDVMQTFLRENNTSDPRVGAIFVGRLVPKKGLLTLMAGFAKLGEQYRAEGLTVIGAGPERVAAERLAASLGISTQVRFLGSMENAAVAPHLRRARMLVAPFEIAPDGDQEGLGLVVVEAMAVGTPVITTTMPATRDAAIPDQTALVCPMGDAIALAAAMQRVFMEPDMAAAMAARAHHHVIHQFSWENATARYAALLRSPQQPET